MVETTQLKQGFKQTEVGVIPEDWEVRELEEVVEFLDGKRRPIKSAEREKMKGQYPYYGASGIIDYVNDYLFDEELILLGEDGENILSRNLPLAFVVKGKVWVNNHAHVLKVKEGYNTRFLSEMLESLDYENYNSGTAQPKLNQKTCASIKIPLPPTLAEQEAIARALSDMDALIAAQGQLIAKKRALKQGAMQELLTGKRRLTGFGAGSGYQQTEVGVIPADWEVKKLGKLSNLIIDGTHYTPKYTNRGVPFLRVTDIQNATVDFSGLKFISASEHQELSKRCNPQKGDLLLSKNGTIGIPKVVDWNWEFSIFVSLCLIKIRRDKLDVMLLEQMFKSHLFTLQLKQLSKQGTVTNLHLEDIRKIEFPLPPTLAEQRAIATALSDMDAELSQLEAQLGKYEQLKQGMMQELLTGKTRLI